MPDARLTLQKRRREPRIRSSERRDLDQRQAGGTDPYPGAILAPSTAAWTAYPQLVISVQPKEGISLSFGAKIPGATLRVGGVDMDFDYSKHFGSMPATGYERLMYDAMLGDQTLFQRADMVEAGWSVVAPVLDVWQALPPRGFPNYAAGTWGPRDADLLLERDGRAWREA